MVLNGRHIVHIVSPLLLSAAAMSLAGCPSGPTTVYPSTPPPVEKPVMQNMPSAMPAPQAAPPSGVPANTMLKVPADAKELSSGDYPPPAFPTPAEPGLILVVDMDGDPTVPVASTAVTGRDAGKPMSITDVPNMTMTMDKHHKYRIVFVAGKQQSQ